MADGRSAREFAAAQVVRRFLETERGAIGYRAVGSKDMHYDATKVTAAKVLGSFFE